jgi:hypothetical protein
MRMMQAGLVGVALLAATLQVNAGMVDAKLLGMLLANGSITQAQHDELMADLAAEAQDQKRTSEPGGAQLSSITLAAPQSDQEAPRKEKLDKDEFVAFQQAAGWAASTALRGDLRVRNEYVNIEDEPKNGGSDKDRQRIRARLGAFTQVNPEVEVGIRIATGSNAAARSANENLDDYFEQKPVWLDLGYLDYHPEQVPGLRLFGGKMRQPWMAVGEVIWDGDVNPEGFAAQYARDIDALKLFGSTGYYILSDNVNGEGVERNHDLVLYALQAGTSFDVGSRVRMTLGASLYEYDNDGTSDDELSAFGNTTNRFGLYEGFGQIDVAELALPLSLFGQYVLNADARDYLGYTDGDEDTAWLLGARTSLIGIGLDYSYRNVERNAVVGLFADSNFAAGYVGSSGHRLRAQYDILKNFSAVVTWFLAESDAASEFNTDGADVDTLMIDLSARF